MKAVKKGFRGISRAAKGVGKFAKKIARPIGKAAIGAGTGFLMGGPAGALAGGLMGGLQKGALTFGTALKAGGKGLLGGLGATAAGGLLAGGRQAFMSPGDPSGLLSAGLGAATGGLGTGAGAIGAAGAGARAGGGFFGGLAGLGRQAMGGIRGLFGGAGQTAAGQAGGGILGGISPLQLAGGVMGHLGQQKQLRAAGALEEEQLGLLREGREIAGISPEARKLMAERAKEQLRGAQAERGIFQSGVSAAQEAELLPLIEAQMQQQQIANIGSLVGGFNPLVQGRLGMAGAF